jgi:O-acetyl-ADP-ribose deacetylase (regulator of RNase III)
MHTKIHHTDLELVQGDITLQATDAIVNAANTSLLGGGGVDGAIHRAAGPSLLEATRRLNGCAVGDAKITPGFLLKARYVIHAVGPVYSEPDTEVAELLARAYRRSLELVLAYKLESVAFPAISTGIYGYPLGKAAVISLNTVRDFVRENSAPGLVRFVLFSETAYEAYDSALRALVST